jgi:hypothetical protein
MNIWAHLHIFTVDYYKKFPTQRSLQQEEEEDNEDLLSSLSQAHSHQGKDLEEQVRKEISAWQGEVAMEIGHKINGQWVYNCAFHYWRQVKCRFPLLSRIAQQVFLFDYHSTILTRCWLPRDRQLPVKEWRLWQAMS